MLDCCSKKAGPNLGVALGVFLHEDRKNSESPNAEETLVHAFELQIK